MEVIEFKQRYKDINDTLYWLVEQAKAGVQYCQEELPQFENPVEMYNYLKMRVKFCPDPPGVELIQNPQTLLEDNFHGTPGWGDCDCFVTLLLSCLWANGWSENYIMLYGNTRKYPTHISCMTVFDGETIYLDLTEPKVNRERPYKFYQEIPVF